MIATVAAICLPCPRSNSPQKFIIVAAWLTLSNGLGAFLAVRYRSTAYNWIIMNVMAVICGLPGAPPVCLGVEWHCRRNGRLLSQCT